MSIKPVQLIPLICVRCQAPVPAQPGEYAWICEQCGQGLVLDETPEPPTAALPLDIFFSADIPAGKRGRPFWVAQCQVIIGPRLTYKGNESRASLEFWLPPRLFFLPAWSASLDETISLGVELIKNPFTMRPGSPVRFEPVTCLPTDMRAMVEFMVMSIEAGRRDALKQINFNIDLQPAQLWILP